MSLDLTLAPSERTLVYHHLEAACAAAAAAHLWLDQAEGATVASRDPEASELAGHGLTELRRALAHFGYVAVPIEDAPAHDQVEALRLMHGGG